MAKNIMPIATSGLVTHPASAYINAGMEIDPVVREFILFCIQRQGKAWPALYDEMCWVAGRRMFRGLGSSDLKRLGLSFSLTSIAETIRMVDAVTADN